MKKIKYLDSILIENNEINFKYILSNDEVFITDEIFFNNQDIEFILDLNNISEISKIEFFNICLSNNFIPSNKFLLPSYEQYNEYLKIIDKKETIFNYSLKHSLSILFLIKIFSKTKNDYLNIYEILKYKFFKNYIENYANEYEEIQEYIKKLKININFLKNKNIFEKIILDLNKQILNENEIFLKNNKFFLTAEFNIEKQLKQKNLIVIGLEKDKRKLDEYIEIFNIEEFKKNINQNILFIDLKKIDYTFLNFLLEVLHIKINVENIEKKHLLNYNKNDNEEIEENNKEEIEEFNFFNNKVENKIKIYENNKLIIETFPFVFTINTFLFLKIIKNSIFFEIKDEKIKDKKIIVSQYIKDILFNEENLNLILYDDIDFNNIENDKIIYINDYIELYKILQEILN